MLQKAIVGRGKVQGSSKWQGRLERSPGAHFILPSFAFVRSKMSSAAAPGHLTPAPGGSTRRAVRAAGGLLSSMVKGIKRAGKCRISGDGGIPWCRSGGHDWRIRRTPRL